MSMKKQILPTRWYRILATTKIREIYNPVPGHWPGRWFEWITEDFDGNITNEGQAHSTVLPYYLNGFTEKDFNALRRR